MIKPEYWAGLFDGEGCVHIVVRRKRYHQLMVEVQLTDKEPIYLLQTQYGGSVKVRDKEKLKGNRKTAYVWTATQGPAIPFLEDILPHSIIKAEQIKIALEFQSRFDSQNFTIWNQIPDEEIEIRNKYRTRLQELKQLRQP